MKRLRLMILMVVTCWMATACSDFLEEKSQDEVIPSTATDFREVLLYYEQAAFSQPILLMDDDVMLDNMEMDMMGGTMLLRLHGCFTWQPDMWETKYTYGNNEYSRQDGIQMCSDTRSEWSKPWMSPCQMQYLHKTYV